MRVEGRKKELRGTGTGGTEVAADSSRTHHSVTGFRASVTIFLGPCKPQL